MNKTDLKERISLSEKFPLIKIMGKKIIKKNSARGGVSQVGLGATQQIKN